MSVKGSVGVSKESVEGSLRVSVGVREGFLKTYENKLIGRITTE